MARHKDVQWSLADTVTYDVAQMALLMDIRDELKLINMRLNCSDTIRIPQYLRAIAANTTKKPRKK